MPRWQPHLRLTLGIRLGLNPNDKLTMPVNDYPPSPRSIEVCIRYPCRDDLADNFPDCRVAAAAAAAAAGSWGTSSHVARTGNRAKRVPRFEIGAEKATETHGKEDDTEPETEKAISAWLHCQDVLAFPDSL